MLFAGVPRVPARLDLPVALQQAQVWPQSVQIGPRPAQHRGRHADDKADADAKGGA